MKHLLAIILAIASLSCSKDSNKSSHCYICETSGYSGQGGPAPYQRKDICTDRVDTVKFYDQNGNALQWVCNEK
jgi:hypothetical protein